jgi:4-amino-4-deoxy-L-arabinose transferase-like glycosyltransferase
MVEQDRVVQTRAQRADSERAADTAELSPVAWLAHPSGAAGWVGLALVTALAAVGYGWGMDRDPLEPYYAAAVRAMAGSWHDLVFGAFDPAGTVTVDKLPGALWVQALSVRLFGVHTWSMVLPQVIEGALTVLVLYRAVRRLAGPGAGLLAAAVLAASPAVVALDRGNISDSLMILLLVLAADQVTAALSDGRQWRLVLAGVWVGLAFQAKMLEAWLVLPALGLAYLVAAPGPAAVRVRRLAVGGVVAGAVSLAWMVAVSLVPPATRPYVDGSAHDSVFEQVFGYNGFGRVGAQSPLQVLAGQGLGLLQLGPPPGWHRLLLAGLGRDAGWLLPLAVLITVAGLLARRREPRTDPVRAGYLLWASWLVILAVAFSLAATVNSYYTAALGPPVAALLALGVAEAWSRRRSAATWWVVVAGVVLSAGYAGLLVRTAGPAAPRWLVPALGAAALLAVVSVLVALAIRPARVAGGVALGMATVAVMLAPAVGSVTLVARGGGAFDTPFESERLARAVDVLFFDTPALAARALPAIEQARAGAPYLMATQSAAVASVFSYPSGQEVLPIGGFTGTQPTPTLSQLRADIAAGRFHLVLAFPSGDPRLVWIAGHCRQLPGGQPPFVSYYCRPTDAG